MPRSDFDRLFNQLDALTVGFGPMFKDFHFQPSGYPPHNIVNRSDTMFDLEIAVSGFKKSQIEIQVLDNILTVRGNRTDKDTDEYQYRGIGNRPFEKKLQLAEHIEVADATLVDGLLTINLVLNKPEEPKPRVIAIK